MRLPVELSAVSLLILKIIDKEKKNLVACILVGSHSLKRASKDSDIDLVFIFEKFSFKARARFLRTGGQKVGLEEFRLEHFLKIYHKKFLNPKYLRETGRLSNGIILFSKFPRFAKLLIQLGSCVLDPKFAEKEFYSISLGLQVIQTIQPSLGSFWDLEAVTLKIAVAALNLTSSKYQKPKWIIEDLRNNCQGIYKLALKILGIRTAMKVKKIKELNNYVDFFLMDTLKKNGLTGLDRSETLGFSYIYLRRTFMDAQSLESDNKMIDALFVKMYCVRILDVFLQGYNPNGYRSFKMTAMYYEGIYKIITPVSSEEFKKNVSQLKKYHLENIKEYKKKLA